MARLQKESCGINLRQRSRNLIHLLLGLVIGDASSILCGSYLFSMSCKLVRQHQSEGNSRFVRLGFELCPAVFGHKGSNDGGSTKLLDHLVRTVLHFVLWDSMIFQELDQLVQLISGQSCETHRKDASL